MLVVTTSSTYEGDFLGSNSSAGHLSSHFEFPFLLVDGHATTSGSVLVSGVSRNTHNS